MILRNDEPILRNRHFTQRHFTQQRHAVAASPLPESENGCANPKKIRFVSDFRQGPAQKRPVLASFRSLPSRILPA